MTTMLADAEVKTIGAAKFKAECLAILDDLDADGIVITKHGKPVARVLPIPRSPEQLIGIMRGEIEVHGDVFSTGVDWLSDD